MELLLKTLVAIRETAEESHGDGLGFVGEGGEDDSGFEWDAVDCLKGQRYDKMKGAETAWNRYQPSETSCQRQEQSIDHIEPVQNRNRPHG